MTGPGTLPCHSWIKLLCAMDIFPSTMGCNFSSSVFTEEYCFPEIIGFRLIINNLSG